MEIPYHLLLKIENKLKQPYNSLNLELSFNLSHNESYYIDSYLQYYLTKINQYCIKSHMNNVYSSELKIMKFLLERGLYLENFDLDENTLLLLSSMYDYKIFKYLINKGSYPYTENNYAETSFKLACDYRSFNTMKYIIKNDLYCYQDLISALNCTYIDKSIQDYIMKFLKLDNN